MLDICRRESVQVVIPIVTRELMKFARARAEFEALGAKVSVMEPDKLEIVNNKAHLLDAMRAHGLRTPEYRRVHTVEKLKAAVSALGYPEKALCVKAAVGNGSRGIRMLNANISRDVYKRQVLMYRQRRRVNRMRRYSSVPPKKRAGSFSPQRRHR